MLAIINDRISNFYEMIITKLFIEKKILFSED